MSRTMSLTIKTAIAAIAVAVAFAPAALAEGRRDQAPAAVAYSDLDMSTPLGGQILLGRIEDAAAGVCRAETDSANPALHYLHRCRRKVVEATVRGADMRMLTLAWRGGAQATSFASR